MLPETGPFGETQGLEPTTQISPTVGLPFGTPLTLHVTDVSGEFVTLDARVARCPTLTVTEAGEIATLTPLVRVNVAAADTASAVAWMVMGPAEGRSAGAV